MIERILMTELLQQVDDMPAVAVLGPRQVGKTTLVKMVESKVSRPVIYLDLESREDQTRLLDPELYFSEREDSLIVLDEIQRMPALFPILRSAIDKNRVAGRFLLSGSASPELLAQSTETLAGRISYLELQPLHWGEVGSRINYQEHWLRGGFPNALLAPSDEVAHRRLNDFIFNYIHRDLALLGLPAPAAVVSDLFSMLVGANANLLNLSNLSRSLGTAQPTLQRYIDFMENAFIIRRLRPWYVNINKRITKSPKIYFRDTGMLHALAGISDNEALSGSMWLGGSWEGYVIQQIIAQLKYNIRPFFYRTADGTELDLVLVKGITPVLGVEIKYSNAPKLSRGNNIALEDLGGIPLIVVTPSAEDYRMAENTKVCSMKTLNENFKEFFTAQ